MVAWSLTPAAGGLSPRTEARSRSAEQSRPGPRLRCGAATSGAIAPGSPDPTPRPLVFVTPSKTEKRRKRCEKVEGPGEGRAGYRRSLLTSNERPRLVVDPAVVACQVGTLPQRAQATAHEVADHHRAGQSGVAKVT